MKEMEQQLETLRQQLVAELHDVHATAENLRLREEELKKKVGALDTLLGKDSGQSEPEPSMRVDPGEPGGLYAPVQAYWRPILQTLVELGGRGRRLQVMESVGKKMKGTLTAEDYQKLRNSHFIRWENRVVWQVSNMRQQGLVKKDSPRGLWEITDDGRKWLDDKNA